jgi:hypothetical protein
VNTLSEGRGAISLKFKKDTYSAIEVLFVVSCLPSAQHRFKLLVGISERNLRSRAISLDALDGAKRLDDLRFDSLA